MKNYTKNTKVKKGDSLMKKKLLAVLATAAMVLGLVGCGQEAPASTESTETTTSVVESTETAST